MKFEQSFKRSVYICLLAHSEKAHFPRQLFAKLCLAFPARMCHEPFRRSAVDSWADPAAVRLTGTACLNAGSSGEEQAPNQPIDPT